MYRKSKYRKILFNLQTAIKKLEPGQEYVLELPELVLEYGISPSLAEKIIRIVKYWASKSDDYEVLGNTIRKKGE